MFKYDSTLGNCGQAKSWKLQSKQFLRKKKEITKITIFENNFHQNSGLDQNFPFWTKTDIFDQK